MGKPQVVIIGAGPGGLAAALQLAHAGLPVTILESRQEPGGRCSTLEADGYRFDVGPTFFLYPRILKEIYQSIGRDLDQEIPMRRLDPQYTLTFGEGGRLDCTPNLEEMDRQIQKLSPVDGGALHRYMADNRTKLARFRSVLESPFNGWRDLLRPDVIASVPWLRPWRSLGGELQSYFRDPRLVVAFSFQSKYLGMSPFRCPSLFSILSFLEYEHGVFHPLGGCGQVSVRMAELAAQMGVDIRYGEAVEQLQFEGRRVVAVQTAQRSYDCQALVVNADFGRAMQRLVPNHLRRRWSDQKLTKKRFSCSTFMLYLGIEGRYDELPHHNIHISADYQRNLQQIEIDRVLPDDPSFYVQNPAVTDPSLAPQGCSGLYVLVPVPHLSPATPWDAEQTARFRQKTLDRLVAWGLTDLPQRVRVERMLTPISWRDDYQVYRGATFNLAHNLGQMLHLRPHNRFEELDGVYLVGGGTHPGSGLPVIYESSRISCRQLLEDNGLSTDFIEAARAPMARAAMAGGLM